MSMAAERIPATAGKGWTIGLWVAQVALAALYGMAGANKLSQTPEALIQMGMLWVDGAPLWLVRFIGAAELLGCLGLILPSLTRIMPQLTPLAAVGLSVIQVLAIPLHLSRGEFGVVPVNLVILAVSLFVVWGRSRKAPILPRVAS